MSDAEWAAKYSRQKRTPEDEPLLAGFNWKTVRILSSSTLSSQDTSLVQLVLKVEHPDGKSTHETLELTAPELRDFIASIEQADIVWQKKKPGSGVFQKMFLQCLACGNIVLSVAQAQECKSCGNGVMCRCKAVNHLGQTCQEHALRHILSEAMRFAKKHLPSGTFHSNGLVMGGPGAAALSRFLAAQSDIPPVSAGQFGWHGTKSVSAVLSICREGWDPTLRRNKSGEFFAKDPQTSMGYAGPTNMMVVAFIRSGSWLSDNGYLIVNNPLNRSAAYVLPVGVVTYNGAAAPPLRPPCVEG